MRVYSVAIEFGAEGYDPEKINYYLDDFSRGMQPFSGAVTGSPDEPHDGLARYGARLVVQAENPSAALNDGITHTELVARKVNLPEMPIIHCEVTEWDEFESRVEQPTYPELVGIAELSKLIGVNRQRASQLARTGRFPQPAAELAAGPVWFEPNVRRFIDSWERKPGRPRKEV